MPACIGLFCFPLSSRGAAVKSVCCGNELPERGMWSDKVGMVRVMKACMKDVVWEVIQMECIVE